MKITKRPLEFLKVKEVRLLTQFTGTYKDHVRPFYLEEPFDYLFYRPLAYLMVRATFRLPLSPNHISAAGLLTAITSGYFLSRGDAASYVWGGVGILIFGVLDCCDGMIARLKKNGGEFGELVDMFVDALASLCFFTGLLIGLTKNDFDVSVTFFTLATIPTLLIHAIFYNYYKKQFFYAQKGFLLDEQKERQALERRASELKKENGNKFDRFLLFLYLSFNKAQTKFSKHNEYSSEEYIEIQKKVMPFWGVISGSSHLTILALALLLNKLETGLVFMVFWGNLWAILAFSVQKGALKALVGKI